MFKFLGRLALIVGLVAFATGCSYERVEAGTVGVKVNLLGSEKGVQNQVVGPGRYWLTMNEDMYRFPTFTQNYTWTGPEQLGFQTVEGLAVTADVGISYSIDPDKVAFIFQKYRKGVDEITDLYLRNMVRDALVKTASSMKVESVYGVGKTQIIEQVQKDVTAQVADIGIRIEKIYWIGELRLPPNVMQAINAKIQATQMAEQRRNEVEQAKAEADKAIEAARGEAESRLTIARAEAESIRLRGEALAQTPKLIELQAIDKWDGKLPVFMLGGGKDAAVPFIQVPTGTK